MTDLREIFVSDEEGFSLVMSLWLMALLGIVGGLFAYESLQRTRMTDSIVRRENAYTMARAGIDLWMGQLRADAVSPNGHDAQTENWGWGGELKSGVTMGDTLYVPSGASSYEEGDLGFVAVEKIQDETGKHSLTSPLDTSGDTAERALANAMDESETIARRILRKPDTYWVSPGDVVYVKDLGTSGYEESLRTVSPYRSGGKINLNTAHPDALRGILIRNIGDTDSSNCHGSSCVHYLGNAHEELITALMEHRSGASLTGPYYEEEREALKRGSGTPFADLDRACLEIQGAGYEGDEDFQCDTFKKHVRLDSEGVLRVLVRGGSIDENGEVLNQTILEAYVDRSQDPMQLISLRSP